MIRKYIAPKTKRPNIWVRAQKKKISKNIGTHLIADFWYGKNIEDKRKIKKILIETVKKANCRPLEVTIHKFQPQGITGVVLLEESHIALHFWPEINYLAIDIFTCGDKSMPERALNYLKKELNPQKIKVKKIKRGIL